MQTKSAATEFPITFLPGENMFLPNSVIERNRQLRI